jgi:hypothetical protein
MPETKQEKVWTEFQGAGSAYMVFETYKKSELDASGRAPVFVTPEVIQKKKSQSIN